MKNFLFFTLSVIAEFLKKSSDSKNLTSTLLFEYYDQKQKGSGTITNLFSSCQICSEVFFSKAIHHLAIFKVVFKLFYSIFNSIFKFQDAGPDGGKYF